MWVNLNLLLTCVQVDQVLRVERLRQAIMENLKFEFAKPFLPNAMYPGYPVPYGQPQAGPFPGYRPAGMRGGMPQQAQVHIHTHLNISSNKNTLHSRISYKKFLWTISRLLIFIICNSTVIVHVNPLD